MNKGNPTHRQIVNSVLKKDADGLSRNEVAEIVMHKSPSPIKNIAINQSDFFMVPPPKVVGRGV